MARLLARCMMALLTSTLVASHSASAQPSIPDAITTPPRVESRIGTLDMPMGVPTRETAERLHDHLAFQSGVDAFLNAFSGASMHAIRQGFRAAGVADGDVLIFSRLMDSNSLFLTANADTVYFWSYLDLGKGPLVVEMPPQVLGAFNDMWFRWAGDFGVSGPDRGEGGRYLILPPGYDGPVPEGGFFTIRSRTNGIAVVGRAFLVNDDPAPAASAIREHLKIYPYAPGAFGTSIASYLLGEARLGPAAERRTPRFVEGSGRVMNTIPPNDVSYYAVLNELVQSEPASALDPEIAGQLARLGIVRGRDFAPDDRMRRILAEAAVVGNAANRTIGIAPRPEQGFTYYGASSTWSNPLFAGGYDFMGPPPEITAQGVRPYPATGARVLDARTSFFYLATVDSPAMVMRLAHIGSQYLGTFYDARQQPLDGGQSYRLVLPAGIPAEKFWSVTAYDNQTRSMVATPQRFPRAGSQSYPSPAATPNADGSTTIHFGPTRPAGVAEGNWIQTAPGRGWFVLLRLYSPLPSFFDRSWRPGEIERVSR